MSSQSSGRRRSNIRQYSAEDQALNVISNEAEARLAAKRAARAEAREIRMKEIEKQEKESEGKQDRVHEIANEHSSSKSRQISGSRSGSRRGSTESNDSDAKDVDFKAELRELEEKYKAAMMTSAQLDNEKQSLVYQVELLKDQLEEQDEGYTELQREYKDKCREYEFMKRDLKTMEHELNIFKQQLEIKDKLIMESGFVILANDKGEPVLEKQSTNNGPLPSGAVLVSAETKDFLEKAEGVTLGTSVSDCTSSASPSPMVSTSSVDALDSVEIKGSEWGNKSGNVDMDQLESSRDRASIGTVHVCSSMSTKSNELNEKQSECNLNLKDSFDGTVSETNEGRVNSVTKKHSIELSAISIPRSTRTVSGEDSDECEEFFDAISTPSPLKKKVQEQDSCGSSVDPDDTKQPASVQAAVDDGSCVDLVVKIHLHTQDRSTEKEAESKTDWKGQSPVNNGSTSEIHDEPLAHESEDNCLKQSDDSVILTSAPNVESVNTDVNTLRNVKIEIGNEVCTTDITEVVLNDSEKNEVKRTELVDSDVKDEDKKKDHGKSFDEKISDNMEVKLDILDKSSEVININNQEKGFLMGDNVETLTYDVGVKQGDFNTDNEVTAIGGCSKDVENDTDGLSKVCDIKENIFIEVHEDNVVDDKNVEIKTEDIIEDTDQTVSDITEVKKDDLIEANQEAVVSQKKDAKLEDINQNSVSDISDIKPDELNKGDQVSVTEIGIKDVENDDLFKDSNTLSNITDIKNDDLIKVDQDTAVSQNEEIIMVNISKEAGLTVSGDWIKTDKEEIIVNENEDVKKEDVKEEDLIKGNLETSVNNQNENVKIENLIQDTQQTESDISGTEVKQNDFIKGDQEAGGENEDIKKEDVKEKEDLIKSDQETDVSNQNENVKIKNLIQDNQQTESDISGGEIKQKDLIKGDQEAEDVNQIEDITKDDLIKNSDQTVSVNDKDDDMIKFNQETIVENQDEDVKKEHLILETEQTVPDITEVKPNDIGREVDETTIDDIEKGAKLIDAQSSVIQDNIESSCDNKEQDDLLTDSEQIASPNENENIISKVENKFHGMDENEEMSTINNKDIASDRTDVTEGDLVGETQSDIKEDIQNNNGEDISSTPEECMLNFVNVNLSSSQFASVENPSPISDFDGQGEVDSVHNIPDLSDIGGKSKNLQKSLSVEGSDGEGLEDYDLDDIDDVLQTADENRELKTDDKTKVELHSETSSPKETTTPQKSVSESPVSSGQKKDKSLKSKLSMRKGKKEKHESNATKGEKLDKAESHSSVEPEHLESTLDKHLAEPGLSMTHKKSKKFNLFKKVFNCAYLHELLKSDLFTFGIYLLKESRFN
ncbi:hypothetical protein Btru_060118 [Bulinus truncatus]|nr:hypothetical protein Btru_060118 [Bulinus truncatus]